VIVVGDFPLDLLTPVRHVATELDRAAPAALSVPDMALTYKHANTGDIARVKREYVAGGDASRWFVEKAIELLGRHVESDGKGGYRLATDFDAIRYKRRKLVRLVDEDEASKQMDLRASMHIDRTYHVTTPGRKTPRKLRLHDLAKMLPIMTDKEFAAFVDDVREHGINKPLLVLKDTDLVLDGRHRVAVADALGLEVRVDDFTGTEEQARDRVMSENVHRRHLTIAQQGLLIRELYLPQAEKEAKARQDAVLAENRRSSRLAPIGAHGDQNEACDALTEDLIANWEEDAAKEDEAQIKSRATKIAADRFHGRASARTVERMAPIDNAPRTKEKVRSGEITSALEARRQALEETGQTAPPDVPRKPESAYRNLGQAERFLRLAADQLEAGDGGTVEPEKLRQRVADIERELGRVKAAIRDLG
jgi:hypothetical protein